MNKQFRKRLSPIKWIGVFSFLVINALTANAQFLRTSYFMEGTHYRQQLNPALTPTNGYLAIPFLGSGVSASITSSSLNYNDVIDVFGNGDDFYTQPGFMSRLKDDNMLNANLRTDILSAGWYKGKNFWSVNVGLRLDIGANITRNMFSFLNEMETVEENWRNSNYDISGQQLNLGSYAEVGVGLSREINNRLTVGGRVKALLGVGNLELKIRNMAMNANLPSDAEVNLWKDANYWNGLTGTERQVAFDDLKTKFDAYHGYLNVDAELNTSFKGLELKEENGYVSDIEFDGGKLGLAGYGFGIDLGASYKILDNLTVSAAVLDLGFISWSKGSTSKATVTAEPLEFNGRDFTGMLDPNNIQTAIDAVTTLESQGDSYRQRVEGGEVLDYDMIQLELSDEKKSRSSALASTVVVGAEYGFLNNKLSVGLLSTTRFLQPEALTEVTLSANYRPKEWFNVALSYSAIQSAGKSFGLGLKLGPVFLGTDYMFLGENTKSLNAFIGTSITLGKNKKK